MMLRLWLSFAFQLMLPNLAAFILAPPLVSTRSFSRVHRHPPPTTKGVNDFLDRNDRTMRTALPGYRESPAYLQYRKSRRDGERPKHQPLLWDAGGLNLRLRTFDHLGLGRHRHIRWS